MKKPLITEVIKTVLDIVIIFQIGQLCGVCKSINAFMDRTEEDRKNDRVTMSKGRFKLTIQGRGN